MKLYIYFNNLYLFQHYYFFIQSFTVYIETGLKVNYFDENVHKEKLDEGQLHSFQQTSHDF